MSNTNLIIFGYNSQLSNKLLDISLNYFHKNEGIDFSRKTIKIAVQDDNINDALEEEIIVHESEKSQFLKFIDIAEKKSEHKDDILKHYINSQDNNIFICTFSSGYILTEQDELFLKDIYTSIEAGNNFFCIIDQGKFNDKEDLDIYENYIRNKLGFIFKNKLNSLDFQKYQKRVFFSELEKSDLLDFFTEINSYWQENGEKENPKQKEINQASIKEQIEEALSIPEYSDNSVLEDVWEEIQKKENQEIDGHGYEVIKEKSNIIASVLEDVSVLIGKRSNESVNLKIGGTFNQPGINLVEKAKELTDLAQDIRQGIFKLIVLGVFSNGKSTLINALLGEKILKAKALPTTSIVTMLVHGNSSDILIKYKDDKVPSRMNLDSFFKEFTLSIEDRKNIEEQGYFGRFENIKYAQIERNYRLLENGIRLIDSPGLEDTKSRTELVYSYLNECQAIILVLNAQQLLNKSEREFIEEELTNYNFSNIFFVINKINLVPEDEVAEIKEYLRSQVQQYYLDDNGKFDADFYKRRIFFVNALGALEARKTDETDNSLLKESGITELENELEHFLTGNDRNTAAFETNFQRLSAVISNTRDSINKQREAATKPFEQLEANRAKAEKLLKNLENQKHEIEQTIVRYGELISGKIFSSLMLYLDELNKTWETDSQEFELEGLNVGNILKTTVSQKAKEKVSNIIQTDIEQYFKEKLTQWAKNKVPTIIEQDIEKMMSEVEKQVEDFQFELIQIDNLFSVGEFLNEHKLDTEKHKVSKTVQGLLNIAMLDFSGFTGTLMGRGSWGGFISRVMIEIFLGGTLFVALGPIFGLIAYVIVEIAHVGMQQASFKQRLLKSVGEKLQENLPKEMSKQHDTICEKVQEQFEQQSTKLTEHLQAQINDKRTEQEDILNQKLQQSFSVEQEKARLYKIDSKLNELHNIARRFVSNNSEL